MTANWRACATAWSEVCCFPHSRMFRLVPFRSFVISCSALRSAIRNSIVLHRAPSCVRRIVSLVRNKWNERISTRSDGFPSSENPYWFLFSLLFLLIYSASCTRTSATRSPRVGRGRRPSRSDSDIFFHGMSEGEALSQKKQHQPPFHPQQQAPIGSGPMANMAWQYPPNNMHNMFPPYPGWVAMLEIIAGTIGSAISIDATASRDRSRVLQAAPGRLFNHCDLHTLV